MGCDIHLYKEKKINDVWVTADEGWCDEYGDGDIDVPFDNRFTDRDYNLFGFLVDGVRRNHAFSFKERGLPFNVCNEIKGVSDYYSSDGHSHSYLYLHELKDAQEFMKDKTIVISGMKDAAGFEKLQASIDSKFPTDWSLLYPYCQGTSDPNAISFSIDVDVSHSLSGLQRIIDLFNDVDGDDQRIVFWFDN